MLLCLPTSLMKDQSNARNQNFPCVDGGTEGHQQQWVKACKTGYGAYTSSDFAIAGPLTETVLMGNLAVRSYQYSETNSQGEKIFPGQKKIALGWRKNGSDQFRACQSVCKKNTIVLISLNLKLESRQHK